MTNIATIVTDNPVAVLIDDKTYDAFIAHVKADIAAFKPDLTTEISRKKIGSLAYKITRSKTAIDAAGKKLNEDARAQINAVDAARRKVRDELDQLAATARKPLTDWEDAEKARTEFIRSMIKHIEDCGNGLIGGAQQPFGLLFHELEENIVIDEKFEEFEAEARIAKAKSLQKLRDAKDAFDKAEADRLELERLRAAERDRMEQEAAQKAEAERLAQIERDKTAEAERLRLAEESAKRREEEAAERARKEVLRQAELERQQAEREATKLRLEKEQAIAKAEAEKRAIIEAQERAALEREAEVKRLAAEQAAREADREHRSSIMRAAKEAIMATGADEPMAKNIVSAIVAGKIPNVTLRF